MCEGNKIQNADGIEKICAVNFSFIFLFYYKSNFNSRVFHFLGKTFRAKHQTDRMKQKLTSIPTSWFNASANQSAFSLHPRQDPYNT